MKQFAYGAVALVVWSLVVFGLGRASIPDRTAEVLAWRDSAKAVARDTLISHQRAREAAARLAEAVSRADSTERALAGVEALAVHRGAVVDSLKGALAEAVTASDSVPVLVAIVGQQDTTIATLLRAVEDAHAASARLVGDLEAAAAAGRADRDEIARLRATIAAGLQATKPSRGRGRLVRCVAGAGVTTGGSGFGGMCGLAVL